MRRAAVDQQDPQVGPLEQLERDDEPREAGADHDHIGVFQIGHVGTVYKTRMSVVAFAPGRVNLIGEHTDYNGGLALPFAIEQGVRVHAALRPGSEVIARALDRDESERFEIGAPGAERHGDWRDFVRGMIAELTAAGFRLKGAELEISGDVPEGGGMSSSAALEVALCLALLAASGQRDSGGPHEARAALLPRGERLGRRAYRPARPACVAGR